jgi:glycosidase
MPAQATNMREQIFGSLSTLDKRTEFLQKRLSGVQHLHRIEPLLPQPGEPVTITATTELPQRIERVVCRVVEPETAVIPLYPVQTAWDMLNWAYYQVWQAELPPQPENTVVRYQIEAYPADGSQPILANEKGLFSYLVQTAYLPEWTKEAIIYQIFPDRFALADGRSWPHHHSLNDIYGGTLHGIIEKLDYVADLGCNAIWLNPVLPDHTHHNYHATDFFAVNPRLGTLDNMRQLVAEAHRRGLRLIMDFVPNHCGSRHPAFQAAQADRHSAYYDWFIWHNWPHDYETFFGVRDLPQLNTDHPTVRQYMLDSARFWLGDIGFDGLRLDYALGPSHDFWTALRQASNEVKPDVWLFGEVVRPSPVQLSYAGRMNGCLDFMLNQALRRTFALGEMDLAEFDNFLHLHDQYFPETYSRPSFLDNHDMNRFLWLAEQDKRKLKLAALCQFTLAGPPIVYYGTEVGLSQYAGMHDGRSDGMAECRRPMLWGEAQDADLLAFYRWLIGLRRGHKVLLNGRRHTSHLDRQQQTYAYTRSNEAEALTIAFNLSEETRMIETADHTFMLPPMSGDVAIKQG